MESFAAGIVRIFRYIAHALLLHCWRLQEAFPKSQLLPVKFYAAVLVDHLKSKRITSSGQLLVPDTESVKSSSTAKYNLPQMCAVAATVWMKLTVLTEWCFRL